MVSGFISVRLQLGSAGDWVGRCNFRAVLTNRCFPGRLLRVFFAVFRCGLRLLLGVNISRIDDRDGPLAEDSVPTPSIRV